MGTRRRTREPRRPMRGTSGKLATDVLVVGSGIAGLSVALHAARFARVLIVTKREGHESNTNYAQGGIAAALGEDDRLELH